jgi:hypothetical protein
MCDCSLEIECIKAITCQDSSFVLGKERRKDFVIIKNSVIIVIKNAVDVAKKSHMAVLASRCY